MRLATQGAVGQGCFAPRAGSSFFPPSYPPWGSDENFALPGEDLEARSALRAARRPTTRRPQRGLLTKWTTRVARRGFTICIRQICCLGAASTVTAVPRCSTATGRPSLSTATTSQVLRCQRSPRKTARSLRAGGQRGRVRRSARQRSARTAQGCSRVPRASRTTWPTSTLRALRSRQRSCLRRRLRSTSARAVGTFFADAKIAWSISTDSGAGRGVESTAQSTLGRPRGDR